MGSPLSGETIRPGRLPAAAVPQPPPFPHSVSNVTNPPGAPMPVA